MTKSIFFAVPRVWCREKSRWPGFVWFLVGMVMVMACGAPSSPGLVSSVSASVDSPEHGLETAVTNTASLQDEGLPLIAIDTHVDTTQRMLDAEDDLADRLTDGHLDLPRMREGGLSGAFFSIWVSPREFPGEAAWTRALALIGAVEHLAAQHPEQAAICRSAREVRQAHREGKIALLLGVEGGHALGDPANDEELLERLRQFYARGVRYMTVTWSNDNRLAHASTGDAPQNGLTPIGRRAIEEMNRLGMIIDISHVSDQTFWDISELSERPLLASHSSCRALSDHPRNMSDAMIRRLAQDGGAICINYYTRYLDADYAARRRAVEESHAEAFAALRTTHSSYYARSQAANALVRELAPNIGVPTLETLVAHFAHVRSLVGDQAVCLGSDFDGVGELPIGMEDVSRLPGLRSALQAQGFDISAVFGENVLRVLEAQQPD